jgi:hypothetical protein
MRWPERQESHPSPTARGLGLAEMVTTPICRLLPQLRVEAGPYEV